MAALPLRRLAVAALLLLSVALVSAAGGSEGLLGGAAKERAHITPEEIAQQLADNTISDANLLPTRPAPKDYTPSGQPEFALLMTPGRGKGCNLKKFPNLQQFLREDAHFYPSLLVDYQVAVDPKLKFYPSAEQRDAALIHGGDLTEEQLLALLVAGPDSSKDPLLSVELSDNDPTAAEIVAMLKEHNVQRAFEGDDNHSARLIFKPDFVPIED